MKLTILSFRKKIERKQYIQVLNIYDCSNMKRVNTGSLPVYVQCSLPVYVVHSIYHLKFIKSDLY